VVEDLLREAQKKWDDDLAREKSDRERVRLEEERRLAEARRREAEARRVAADRRLAADQADVAAREREERDKPVYRRWWFWGVVGAGVAVAAGGAVWALSGTDTVLPGGSLGTVDGR
jgi:hypothetical protein